MKYLNEIFGHGYSVTLSVSRSKKLSLSLGHLTVHISVDKMGYCTLSKFFSQKILKNFRTFYSLASISEARRNWDVYCFEVFSLMQYASSSYFIDKNVNWLDNNKAQYTEQKSLPRTLPIYCT